MGRNENGRIDMGKQPFCAALFPLGFMMPTDAVAGDVPKICAVILLTVAFLAVVWLDQRQKKKGKRKGKVKA